jgi:transcriptional regulator with PAS, ATPase and Fis domain
MEPKLIGVSQNIQRIRALIDQIADTGLNTIIYGETGVGKELIVQCLYHKSNRVGKPFVKVNCAALPDTLLESEMFGYEQGAFTGAERRKRGKFEQAHGGVLFLENRGYVASLAVQIATRASGRRFYTTGIGKGCDVRHLGHRGDQPRTRT